MAIGLHAQAPAPALMSAELAVLLFRLFAKLPELFGIVQNMGEPFFLFWSRLGTWCRLPGVGCRDEAVMEPVA